MRQFQIVLIFILTVLTLSLFGCAGKRSVPTSPEIFRDVQTFSDAIEIFGPATSGDDFIDGLDEQPFYHDIDLGQMAEYETGDEVDNDYHSCVSVTLNRQNFFNAGDLFKPVLRWLDATNMDSTQWSDPIWVADREADGNPINDLFEYRAPAVAAIFDPSGDVYGAPGIEVVVAYEYRDDTVDETWRVGVTALHWYGDELVDWWTKEPTERFDYDIELPEYLPDNDEHNPDIAYNYRNGDVFMVYSEYQLDSDQEFIKYRHFHREHPNSYFSDEFLIGRYATNPHNGYSPSIDVGLINIDGIGDLNMVAVTYTSQFHTQQPIDPPHVGYHLCGMGWSTDVPDINQPSFQVRHEQNYWRDAGLSFVDIAPYDNTTHFVTCTYTQVTGADGFGPTTSVMVVNWFGSAADLLQHRTVNDLDLTTDDGMYSSIAIHNDLGGECWGSVNYLAQANDGQNQNGWHPRVSRLQLDHFPTEQVNNEIAGTNPIVFGNYNISDIPFQNPGVSTAIMTNNADLYWAAWANRIEMEPPPTFITAAYGDSF
jgi:hypothetical protein